ncbi:sensor histidine kinase [Virgisporangium aurantiacum]|nr:histidine kinase [Virgisporangium aurantiacum]
MDSVMSGQRRAVAGEVGLAVGLLVLCLATLPVIARVRTEDKAPDLAAVALIVVATAALAFRRRWPVATLVVATVATSAYLVLGYPPGPVLVSAAVGVYSVARRLSMAVAAVAAGGALVVLSAHIVTDNATIAGLIPATAWVAIPFTVGVARRMVQEAVARERAEAERRLVDAERLRLAQEVHDVVGHGLAAIQMQADIALHMQQTKPGQAHVALAAISRASSDALAELRATLAAITPDVSGDRAPTPGLARVDDLRRRVEDAGVTVDLAVQGPPRTLPAAADLAAYRILQESLTNVVKHSPHPMATVEIAYRAEGVTLTVANQDLDAGSHVEGFGIAGMRRRVAHLGGTLTAGTGRAGVFEVRAEIPTPADVAEES